MPSSYAPHVGGVEEVARQLARGLLQAGHQPSVVTNRWPKDLPEHETLDEIPIERHSFRVPHRSIRGIGGWLLYAGETRRSVISAARERGCDVVNLHCASSNARYAMATSEALGVPLVVSIHGELSGDAANVYERSATLRRMLRQLLDRADIVTAPSEYTLAEAERFYGRALRASQVIRNGVDVNAFSGARDVSNVPFVLAAGRLVANKGFDLLIDAWAQLPKALSEVRLVIAGDGPETAALKQMSSASPAAGRIEFAGRLSRDELARRMRLASAFVLPSKAEALGLVVLEAMAAGTPVVAAAVGGVPEVVRDGVTGLLFPADDPAAFIERLTDVLTDESGARQRARAASDLVAGMSWQACTDAFLTAYAKAGVSV